MQIQTNGGAWQTLASYSGWSGGIWHQPWIDLSAYTGQTIRLAFRFYSGYYGGSAWFIDDIQIVSGPVTFNNPESFEAGWGDWFTDFGVWEVGHPTNGLTCGTGTNWAATILNGNYPDNCSSHLVSPVFIVPSSGAHPKLRFWHQWNFSSSDWGQVQVSTNNGTSWIALSPQYTGSSGCTLHILDLSAYAGQKIQIGFYVESHSPNTADGWCIDDVFIQCDALHIPSLPSSVNESTLWTFTCASIITNPVFALEPGAPTGAAINPGTGVFTWTPSETQGPGAYSMTIRLTQLGNSLIPVNTGRFSIVVNEWNERPVLSNVSAQVVNELAPWSYQLLASDPDIPTNPLTFSLVSGPSGMTVSPLGAMNWTPSEIQGSNYTITVRVTDTNANAVNEHQLSDTRSFTFTVNEVNTAPGLAPIANQTLDEGITLSITNVAWDTDIPTNPLTFSLVSPPSDMTIGDQSGILTWTPSEAQGPGTYTINVKVTDYNADAINEKHMSATQSFTVTVREVNTAPVLENPPDYVVHPGQTVAFYARATDVDLPANTITYYGNPWIDPNTGFFSWRATNGEIFSIQARDNGIPPLVSSQQTFSVEIGIPLTIANIFADNQTCRVVWTSISGIYYNVECRNDISTGSWSTLWMSIPATNHQTEAYDPAVTNLGRRFYRVLTSP